MLSFQWRKPLPLYCIQGYTSERKLCEGFLFDFPKRRSELCFTLIRFVTECIGMIAAVCSFDVHPIFKSLNSKNNK